MKRQYTSSQHHLLDWLSKEDHSARGECKGHDLDLLMDWGLARTCHVDARGSDFDRITLTDMGLAEARLLGEWKP